MDQLRADTVVDLLAGNHLSAQPGPRKGVVDIRVPWETLVDLADEPAELDGYGFIAADIARQIIGGAHQATWRWSLQGPDGQLLDRGVTRRRPTTDDAEFVRARDRTCRFPGCRIPAWQCELDHFVQWINGGPSTVDNTFALCDHHHDARHQGRWRYEQLAPGILRWYSPLGQTRIVGPPTQVNSRQRR